MWRTLLGSVSPSTVIFHVLRFALIFLARGLFPLPPPPLGLPVPVLPVLLVLRLLASLPSPAVPFSVCLRMSLSLSVRACMQCVVGRWFQRHCVRMPLCTTMTVVTGIPCRTKSYCLQSCILLHAQSPFHSLFSFLLQKAEVPGARLLKSFRCILLVFRCSTWRSLWLACEVAQNRGKRM
jgi:hypothetical protein